MPFSFAHGGLQVQIMQTRGALERLGVEVEFLRWWDGSQSADVLHHFGRMSSYLVSAAQQKGFKVVITDLLTAQGSRSSTRTKLQKFVRGVITKIVPRRVALLNWDSYRLADACLALTEWEAFLLSELYGAPRQKTHVIPNGVEEEFLNSRPGQRGPWLVCTATITERKRVVELAEAAVRAGTLLWVIGKPYSEADRYARKFLQIAGQNAAIVRYEGPITDRAKLAQVYREARGFVLLSAMESLSLSALEAAACECPLLLSDLPWARTVFGQRASYCSTTWSVAASARALRKFYDEAPVLKPPSRPLSWLGVGKQLKELYENLS
jgi:glycosyltransferase involved in cell wall biosynthesis